MLADVGDGWLGPWTFASPAETTRRLEAAGFTDVEAWLTDEPTPIEPGAPLREYLRTVILGAHLERLPAADRGRRSSRRSRPRLPASSIDYVRLNILATRGETSETAA